MELKKRKIFDGPIERGWDTSINPPTSSVDSDKEYEEYEDKDVHSCVVPDIEDTVDVNGKLLNQQPTYDKILLQEFSLPFGEEMTVGRVTRRDIGPDGSVAGSYDDNSFINSIIYEV